MGQLAPVYQGWNVWSVYQSTDLDFSVMGIGLSRDTRLRIWIEDQLRVRAPGADVADPLDFKGSMIEILRGQVTGLAVSARKEDVPGPAMLVDAPAELRYVRFFNRGQPAMIAWPYDSEDKNYLLNEVFQPANESPLTSGPGPGTITGGVIGGVVNNPAVQTVTEVALVGGIIYLLAKLLDR